MKSPLSVLIIGLVLILQSCSSSRKATHTVHTSTKNDTEIKSIVRIKKNVPAKTINTKNIVADDVVVFAESLQGVPYKYGSTDIKKGFDCSGFINYVFDHFNIKVPRSSVDFTNAGREVSMKECLRGDIILFTGSDANSGVVGHMGIITDNRNKKISFIHASSGGGRGVMISGMSDYFITRFVKVIRIFGVFE